MDVDRLRAIEAEEQKRMNRNAAVGVASGVVNPPPPVVRESSAPFSNISLRLGMLFTVLGAVFVYHALMGESTTHPEGEIPQAIFRHYGPQGLLVASGVGGALMLAIGVCMLAYFFKKMPRRLR